MTTARALRCDVGDSPWNYCGRPPLPDPRTGPERCLQPEALPDDGDQHVTDTAIQIWVFTAFNPAAAVRLAEGLLAARDSLANFPHRGRRVSNTDMRELITDYPLPHRA
jgi:hypothetical protein